MTDFKEMANKCKDNAIYYYKNGNLAKGRKYEKDAKYFEDLAKQEGGEAKKTTLKEVKKGDFFRLTDSDTATVYIKGDYDRSERKYEAVKYYDVNDIRFMNGTRTVYIGFTF